MESMRDINRVMEREIAKGSCPLKLDHIEFGDYSYQEITSKEKLLEVLSYLLRIGDFKQYAGKTILNNVYMDLRGKKPVFKRTKTVMERNNIFATIRRYHVYEYDAKEHELFRSDRAEEHTKQKEEKRDEKKERPSLKERLAEKKNDVMKMDADRKQPTADKKKEAVI